MLIRIKLVPLMTPWSTTCSVPKKFRKCTVCTNSWALITTSMRRRSAQRSWKSVLPHRSSSQLGSLKLIQSPKKSSKRWSKRKRYWSETPTQPTCSTGGRSMSRGARRFKNWRTLKTRRLPSAHSGLASVIASSARLIILIRCRIPTQPASPPSGISCTCKPSESGTKPIAPKTMSTLRETCTRWSSFPRSTKST